MLGLLFNKIFGTKASHELNQFREIVEQINQLEVSLQALPDAALREKTQAWKNQLSAIQELPALAEALEKITPEAFAVVKNACRRLCGQQLTVRGHPLTWDMIPFDVQLIGGLALHRRRIAEMATGEGKTLVATLPAFLNALTGRGVHIVTVNDYLAARDSEWMGAVYQFLGLTVGCILNDQPPEIRRQMYARDITFGTNAEFGFDYLRDNGMAQRAEAQVQRGQYFAIIDEVDSILLDEARTPLIITGPTAVNADNSHYERFKPAILSLAQNQSRLCERYLREAQRLIDQLRPETEAAPLNRAEAERQLGLLLYKVRLGAPRSAGLMKLMEDPGNQRLMSQAELKLHADQSKEALYAQKEELFFAIEEKSHEADLTEKGRAFLEPQDPDAFVLPDLNAAFREIDRNANPGAPERLELKTKLQADFEARSLRIHVIAQLLKAYCLYEKDVDYVVQDGKVVIVDEHTGRIMTGRRWSDGLHQAVEAKENVAIERETQTLATITIQNYFRLYHKLAGMTGTAETEVNEFSDIYKLGVLVIPTNQPVARQDRPDSVYKTRREKFAAVVKEIQEEHGRGRPILAGTVSVETSEQLSKLLTKAGIAHSVLNAKFHQQEAEIVARAGQRGAVTIATNMAGRGTDIKLGEGVAVLGGLHVLATERHEARRIDRQLRGRCARQGDPGSSHFFISMEDDLIRVFGSESILRVMERVKLEPGQELKHPLLSRSIQATQKRVEQHHFQIRKRTLEYDDVMNKQREILYGFRNEIIHSEQVHDRLLDVLDEVIVQKLNAGAAPEQEPRDWNLRGFVDWLKLAFPVGITAAELLTAAGQGAETPAPGSLCDGMSAAQFAAASLAIGRVREAYELKRRFENPAAIQSLERFAMLSAIDRLWQEHLGYMDSLRNAIGLRSYGQRDPLIEYQAEAFKTFEELMLNIKGEICQNLFRSASNLRAYEQFLRHLPQNLKQFQPTAPPSPTKTAGVSGSENDSGHTKAAPVRTGPKVGRNDPCPCGSGKKFKQCCGH